MALISSVLGALDIGSFITSQVPIDDPSLTDRRLS
jgi:hypothetical protein